MASKNVSEFLKHLSKEQTKLVAVNAITDISKCLKELHQIIKNHFIQVPHPNFLEENEQEGVYSILMTLSLMLMDDNCVADVMLMCSTCISHLVATMFNPEFSSSFLIYLYYFFDKNYSGTKKHESHPLEESLKDELTDDLKLFIFSYHSSITPLQKLKKYFSNELNPKLKAPSFQQIAILNGVVSCQVSNFFFFKLSFWKDNPFMIFIFNSIYLCCLSPSVHQYHAFNALLNWLRICRTLFLPFPENKIIFFSPNSDVVQKILCLLESNWQNPMKGINGFTKEMYKLLIILSKPEIKEIKSSDMQLIHFLLKKAMTFSWQTKGKYLMLAAVLQYIDYFKFFDENCDAPLKIISNLKANYIASSISDVYKVIVTNMKNLHSEEEFYSIWCEWWKTPIIKSLCSNDKLLFQNITNYILPWTLKQCPKSYDLLMDLDHQDDNDSIKLLLLRIKRASFSCILSDEELILINKNLHNSSIQFRSEILSILCSSPKKSEPVKKQELNFLKTIISQNLNIDCAPFHQHLLSQLRILLTRIRDSLAQEYRIYVQNNDYTIGFAQLEFVDWLAHTAIQNTFPGACYQRRRISLYILNIINDVFIQLPMGLNRKEKPSKCIKLVIEWAQKRNFWQFFIDDSISHIVPCLTDFTDEIRTVSADLLLQYSSWPYKIDFSNYVKDPTFEFALLLCNHPDYRNNDGGAHMCCIILKRLYYMCGEKECSPSLEFLKHLVSISKLQLACAKEDIVIAAIHKPIHGILLALQYCLANSEDCITSLFQLQAKETLQFIKELIIICFDTIHYMLKIMKGDDDHFNCPSFMDISRALEKLVMSKTGNSSDATFGKQLISNIQYQEYVYFDCNSLCELLLSCCWHSIKNSCFLLCEVSTLIIYLKIDHPVRKQMLQDISKQFSSILLTCRHRGVLEACCEALKKFCICLLKDKVIYQDITKELLTSVFKILEDITVVSVTRRSAGLPLFFQAIVTSEENNINRHLLSFTIDYLMNLISKPLPSDETVSEKTDLPQAHSYHILKAIVSDASLSQCILSYFDDIIPVCISGFSSPIWAIRNGALQLFGVVLPKVCGQKKVRDDDSEYNMVFAFELFSRCPSLKAYLLQELDKCVIFHNKNRLCSELVPVLSLLVKLVPEQEQQRKLMIDFIPLLLALLDIPIWKVRDLVTTALSILLSTVEVFKLVQEVSDILEKSYINLNKIHSILLMLQKTLQRDMNNVLLNIPYVEKCLMNLYLLIEERINSYLLSGILIDMMLIISNFKNDVSILKCIRKCETYCNISQNQRIGFSFYRTKTVQAQLKLLSFADLPFYLKRFSVKNKDVQIVCVQFLSDKINVEKSTEFCMENNLKHWEEILVSITDYISNENHPSVIKETLELMIDLCNDWPGGKIILDKNIGFTRSLAEHLQSLLHLQSGLSISALSFTMWTICIRVLLKHSDQNLNLDKWNLLFSSYCLPRSIDILRIQAAKSLAILGPSLAIHLETNIESGNDLFVQSFINLCEGSLHLLQDEDQNIRNEACKFPSQIPHKFFAAKLQFNIGIKVVFQYMLKVLHSQQTFLSYLWNKLQTYPSTVKILQTYCNVRKISLFEQEYVNVFSEPQQLMLYYVTNFKAVLEFLREKDYKLYQDNIIMYLRDLKTELQDVHLFLFSIDTKILNQSFTYHHLAFGALKKLRCQVDILTSQHSRIVANNSLSDELSELNVKWSNIEEYLPSTTCWFLNQM